MTSLTKMSLLSQNVIILLIIFTRQFYDVHAMNSSVDTDLPQITTRWGADQLLHFVEYVIENGVPKLNIPKLDPLYIEETRHFNYINMPGIIELFYAEFGNVIVRNLGNFDKTINPFEVNGILPPWSIKVDFNFSTINAEGQHINISIILGEAIPFYCDGYFIANGSNWRVSGEMLLDTNDDEYVYVPSLTLDLMFGTLKVHISNVMDFGNTKKGKVLNDLIGEVTPLLAAKILPIFSAELVDLIITSFNEDLLALKLKLPDLINCIMDPESEKCPLF